MIKKVKGEKKMSKQMINEALSDDILKNALDFTEFLEKNEMKVNGSEISYKGKAACYMHLDGAKDYPSPWTIWTEGDYSSEYEAVPINEQMKNIAWANVNKCGDCGTKCKPGNHKVIFGKEFDNVCSADMAFYKPDAQTLECVKKLLEMRKYEIEKHYGISYW